MVRNELREALRNLAAHRSRPLRSAPDVDSDLQIPVRIALAPWASRIAAELHERFGDEVALTVGFLAYPSRQLLDFQGRTRPPPQASGAPLLDSADVEVRAPVSLQVRTGQDLRTHLEIANHRTNPVVVTTSGSLFARVLEPSTLDVVGGFSGTVAAPLVRITIEPSRTARVPLVVGTASVRGSLGYAVPPGDWAAEIILALTDGERRAPLLPLRVED